MHWFYLILAILAQVSGATSIKLSKGFTGVGPSVLVFVFYGLMLGSFTLALRRIDVSVAYAIWSGLGMAIVATVGVLWFKEPINALKIVSLVLQRDFAVLVIPSDRRESRNLLLVSVERFLDSTPLRSVPLGMTNVPKSRCSARVDRAGCDRLEFEWRQKLS